MPLSQEQQKNTIFTGSGDSLASAMLAESFSDFKVRVLDTKSGTAAKVRVLIESQDESDSWTTIGVSENIIEASWQALVDAIEYKLIKDKKKH